MNWLSTASASPLTNASQNASSVGVSLRASCWNHSRIWSVTEEERQVTELLREDSTYTTAKLAESLGVSRKTVSKRLKNLKERGIIERVGSDRKGYWKLFL